MPIYMDRHDIPGLTAEDVAEGHKQDLKIQDQFNCRALTYWYDERRETAFCLIEAPDEKAVHDLHNHAHGLMPNRIIEVDTGLVEAFLGRIKDPEFAPGADDSEPLPIKEPAFRTIMAVEINNPVDIKFRYGRDGSFELFNRFQNLLQETVEKFGGRMAARDDAGLTASFISAPDSYRCALAFQEEMQSEPDLSDELDIAIGLGAGDPVTANPEFFGETMQLAKRLGRLAGSDQIVISSAVRERCRNNGLVVGSGNGITRTLNPDEEWFLNRFLDVMDRHWNVADLKIADLCREVGLSRSQFYRKLTSLTSLSPSRYVRQYRLSRAARLIEKQQGNLSQIAFETGFSNPSYFSKCFRKRFGISPSQYRDALA